MELTGETMLQAPRARVAAVLRDHEVMCRLLPAAQDLVPVGGGVMEGVLVLGIPPLAQRYPVRVALEQQGSCLRLRAAGTGRAEGMWLQADCALVPGVGDRSTRLIWRLTADVGALGRLMGDGVAARLIAGFLDGLQRELVSA